MSGARGGERFRGASESSVPRYAVRVNPKTTTVEGGPAGWKSHRLDWTIGVAVISIMVSLVCHWLSQIVAGAVGGFFAGAEAVLYLTESDFGTLVAYAWAAGALITIAVTVLVTEKAAHTLTWRDGWVPRVRWRSDFWPAILTGTLIYGVGYFAFFAAGVISQP
jgi:hypothetical protein